MEDLKTKAIELGIENAETLTPTQLKKAVEAAQAKLNATEGLLNEAFELGINPEGLSEEELKNAIFTALDKKLADDLAAEKTAHAIAVSALLTEYFRVDFSDLSVEEVKTFLENYQVPGLQLQSTPETENENEGKSFEEYKSKNGNVYLFADDAPASFRLFDMIKTQKEWQSDKDIMELMIEGNLSFLTLKK